MTEPSFLATQPGVVSLSEGQTSSLALPDRADAAPELDVGAIYDDHFDFVWCALRRLGVRDYQLEDAVQDVFVVVQRRLPDFEQRSTLATWLYGIALRIAKDHRRRHVKRGIEVPSHDDALVGTAPDPRQAALQAEAAQLVQDLLDTLDEDRRVVFILAELEEFTALEIAETLGLGINSVYSRLRLARRDFQQALKRHRARADRQAP